MTVEQERRWFVRDLRGHSLTQRPDGTVARCVVCLPCIVCTSPHTVLETTERGPDGNWKAYCIHHARWNGTHWEPAAETAAAAPALSKELIAV